MGLAGISDVNIVDSSNSTNTPLPALGTFEGNFTELTGFSSVTVSCLSDVGSQFSGLFLIWSSDGVNEDFAPQRFTFDPVVVSQDGFTVHATVRAKYVKVKYINNVNPQTFFTLTTLLRKGTPAGTVRTIDPTNTFTTNLDVQTVQSLMAGVGFQNPEQVLLAQMDDSEQLTQGAFLYVSARPTTSANIKRTVVPATLTPTLIVDNNFEVSRVFLSITNDVLRGNLYLQLNTEVGLSPTQYDFKIPPGHVWQDPSQFGSVFRGDVYGVWDEVYIHSVPIQEGHARVVDHYHG